MPAMTEVAEDFGSGFAVYSYVLHNPLQPVLLKWVIFEYRKYKINIDNTTIWLYTLIVSKVRHSKLEKGASEENMLILLSNRKQ